MGSISTRAKPYPPGVHVPSLTWFEGTQQQEIDWALQRQHLDFLVKSDLHGGMYWHAQQLLSIRQWLT